MNWQPLNFLELYDANLPCHQVDVASGHGATVRFSTDCGCANGNR